MPSSILGVVVSVTNLCGRREEREGEFPYFVADFGWQMGEQLECQKNLLRCIGYRHDRWYGGLKCEG